MSNTIQRLYEQGQSVWCDNLSRRMLDAGELQRLIDLGVVGVTSNPTIFMKAITGGNDYDRRIDELSSKGKEINDIYEALVLSDIADAADQLRPVYDRTAGIDGYVSLEVNPKLAYDTDATVAEARRLFQTLNRPNIMMKVPATAEGIPAIAALIGEGVNVNVTLIFSLAMYEQVMAAYLEGIKRLVKTGGDLSRAASVASFFVSRVDTLVDKRLEARRSAGGQVDRLLGQAAVANARLAYERFEKTFGPNGEFNDLALKGARVQRPLWASTSTKNPAYSPTKYVDNLVASNTVNTLPPDALEATLKNGGTRIAIRDDLSPARTLFDQLAAQGIRMDEVTDQLRIDGVKLFEQSFDDLLANLERKRRQLRATG